MMFQEDSDFNRSSLRYENYIHQKIYLPEMNNELFISHYFPDDVDFLIEELKDPSKYPKVGKDLFEILCNQAIINEWDVYENSGLNPYSEDFREFTKIRKKEIVLYNLGKIEIDSGFNTHLILSITPKYENMFSMVRKLYMINTINNELKSIVLLANYFCFDGNSNLFYTSKIDKNLFLFQDKNISSDIIDSSEEEILDESYFHIEYSFDENGFLNISQ
jgi:hypothetical protein